MNTDGAISSLMFFTLAAVVVIAVALALHHFRKRGNRAPMEGIRERNYDEMKAGKTLEREP